MQLGDRIGAWKTEEACFFRVWAPHAERVRVLIQDGPHWETDDHIEAHNLMREGDYWSVTVAAVPEGKLYRFEITHNGVTFQRLDPAARDVLHSELTRHDPESRNASIVLTDVPFAWSPFDTPRFEDFIIYQFHVGSFAGRNDEHDKLWATFADVETKLGYIREMGFSAVELLPIHEYSRDRSWGYNPASFFAPESSYGSPRDLEHFVDSAHRHGLAVIFDVVYNHAGPDDSILWAFDGYHHEGGIYFEGGQMTSWGRGPAWHKGEVQDYFYQNARMYLEDYGADGLRFDVTTQINGDHLKRVIDRIQVEYRDKYIIAEHLPADPWIIKKGGFDATWDARAHHECQRALGGDRPLGRVKSFLGWDGYDHAWNLVKYTLGSHDDVGDQNDGNAEDGLTDWDRRHRYFVDQFGGREDWLARAKCRLAWALNIAMPGTPMLFMGSECMMGAPHVAWGYWHDGLDRHGDHRFDWSIAGDTIAMEMRRLVTSANQVRQNNPALRFDSLTMAHEDPHNQVLAFLREYRDNAILTVVNLSDRNFTDYSYGVRTAGRFGQWTQELCTQDAQFGGWDGAGNAFYEPWTQAIGQVYINLPQWSVLILRRK